MLDLAGRREIVTYTGIYDGCRYRIKGASDNERISMYRSTSVRPIVRNRRHLYVYVYNL
jgi:hypothetical protein